MNLYLLFFVIIYLFVMIRFLFIFFSIIERESNACSTLPYSQWYSHHRLITKVKWPLDERVHLWRIRCDVHPFTLCVCLCLCVCGGCLCVSVSSVFHKVFGRDINLISRVYRLVSWHIEHLTVAMHMKTHRLLSCDAQSSISCIIIWLSNNSWNI